ncbi:helix-turn-helix domain-containing protein [Streptomyces sp. URMC 124]|uniref:helix-turn-helix domain-containing protein n=1 Tax=Streptomyces sp. URMC 124 TaxID=3423405 RepID=UPI003F1B8F64
MSYVRNLRLDRIRQDILTTTDNVGTIAYRWGVSHLGRFAGDYRDHFDELPSDTADRVAHVRARPSSHFRTSSAASAGPSAPPSW